jgi:outer membrane protein assembly factor BamE
MRLPLTLAACICLHGCGYFVYKMDVQQGNYVTQDVVGRVKTGMTKAEVRQVLGTPLLSDPFHANRWDYYFSSEKGRHKEDRTQLSIFFENDRVVSVKGEGRPPAPPPVGQAAPQQGAPAPAVPPPSAASPAPANPPTTATVPVGK